MEAAHPQDPWKCILGALKSTVNPMIYQTWLRPSVFDHNGDHRLFVRVPNIEFAEYITEHFKDAIENKWMGEYHLAGPEVRELHFTFEEQEKTTATQEEDEGLQQRPEGCPIVPAEAWHGISRRYLDIVSPCSETSDNYHLVCFLGGGCVWAWKICLFDDGRIDFHKYVHRACRKFGVGSKELCDQLRLLARGRILPVLSRSSLS